MGPNRDFSGPQRNSGHDILRALRPILAALAVGLALACSPAADNVSGPADAAGELRIVSGTATYRERILLRPGSVLEVSVLDVSRADAAAETLASVRLTDPGTPPFAFEIAIDADRIDARRRYVVRATIVNEGELVMTTDRAYPVLTGDPIDSTGLELVLVAVPRGTAGGNPLVPPPASFAGVLPCADCPGIDYQLDLLPDSVYYLRMRYIDRDRAVDAIGAYRVDGASATLTLWQERPELMRFRIVDADRLRLLDRNGEDIESALNYTLERTSAFDPLTLDLPLRGLFTYFADAGSFVECESGRRFAVAQAGDNAALESAWLAARRDPGDSLLVSVVGEIGLRPRVEGEGQQPTLVVERFTGIWPTETCGARQSWSELAGTNWVLTRIGEDPVVPAPGAREPRLLLASGEDRVTGSGGCNDFSGRFELLGSSIRFDGIAATLRACDSGGRYESRLFAALGSTTSYELSRHHFELFDAAGTRLARFEAREL